ncbi:MAG TPA: hypothetical protein VFY79_02615 [Dehalococcoidia bacterium]|nr:hypothetical protein [Dehalococcoidia bacterium]
MCREGDRIIQLPTIVRPAEQRSATPRRVAILTLGCKLNQADSEAIARHLGHRGIEVLDRPAPADAHIINTCSVPHVGDRKARHVAPAGDGFDGEML